MDTDWLLTCAPSTRRLVSVLNYKLTHKTTEDEEKNRINHYIKDIYNMSMKILQESPNNIMTPLVFEKQDLLYFVSILNLYITDQWSIINLDDDIEVECMISFIYVYTALQKYYEEKINTI